MPRTVNNLLGLAVLSYLTERPMHAYELNRTLKDRDAARTFKLSYGALYGVVRQLAEAGLIRAAGTGQRGRLPRHTVYQLTDAGRAEMRAWLTELLSQPQYEYPAFAAALSLVAVLPPDEVTGLLRTRLGHIIVRHGRDPRPARRRGGRGRAPDVPHRGRLPDRPAGGRGGLHHHVHQQDRGPRQRLVRAVAGASRQPRPRPGRDPGGPGGTA